MLVCNESTILKYAIAYSFTKWLLSFKAVILGDDSNSRGATINRNITGIHWELSLKSSPDVYKNQ